MDRKVLDTNIFNRLVDGLMEPSNLPKAEYIVTAWQRGELSRTCSVSRRAKLLAIFDDAAPVAVPARSTPWGSPWGSPWDQGGEHYESVLADLEKLKPGDRGSIADAVNIETAIYEQASFVSDDQAARAVAVQYGIPCLTFEELLWKSPREV